MTRPDERRPRMPRVLLGVSVAVAVAASTLAAPASAATPVLLARASTTVSGSAAIEMMAGALSEAPRRVGEPLLGELAGLYFARRGDYRVIYEIDEEQLVVTVHRVQHRREAYRPC